jgi:hypothetical protein
MRKMLLIAGLSTAFAMQVYACPHNKNPNTSSVSYQTSAESTIKVEKAKVLVSLSSTVDPQKASSIKSGTIQQLEKIVPNSQWSIENYNQNMTNSGLLNVSVVFKSRLNSSQVNQLNAQLDSLNTSGSKFNVSSVSYTPNLENIETTKNNLRIKMLGQINNQISQLNKAEGSHYKLNEVSFSSDNTPVQKAMPYAVNYMAKSAANDAQENIKVSQKITMTANVELTEVSKAEKPKE